MHGIATIQSTTAYQLFKRLKVNRRIDPIHVKKLERAIRDKNLLHLNPIVVDADMNVIDGQHRLEAAKRIGCAVFYTQDSKVSMDDIAGMNSNKKNWQLMDYIDFYANKGKHHYITFKKLCYEFTDIHPSIMLNLCSETGARQSKAAREGVLEVSDVDRVRKVIGMISDYGKHTDLIDNSRFAEAIVMIAIHPEYDHERMMQKIQANPTAIVPCANKKQFIQLLQGIYNKSVHEKNIVLFIKR